MILAHTLVTHEGATPARYLMLLHGLLGRGSNLLGLARRFVTEDATWGVVLADLRMHGDSQTFSPPHSVQAAASDVRALISVVPGQVRAIAGHSFGGKVALGLLAEPPPDVSWLCVLDASPSARATRAQADTTYKVLSALQAAPASFASRAEFVMELERSGIDASLGQWLAKNLVRDGERLRFGLDLRAIAELLADHDRADLWPLLETHPSELAIAFVLAGRSPAVSNADQERLRVLSARGLLELYELPNAGHWLHIDDPEGVLRVLARCRQQAET